MKDKTHFIITSNYFAKQSCPKPEAIDWLWLYHHYRFTSESHWVLQHSF